MRGENEKREELKFLAEQWRKDFEQGLKEVIDKGGNLDQIVDVTWQKGILDRIAPTDRSVYWARKELGRTLYPGSRDDVELYWRIIYSMKNLFYQVEKKFSVCDLGYVAPLSQAWMETISEGRKDNFFGSQVGTEKAFEVLAEKIKQKAEETLVKFGEAPDAGSRTVDIGAKISIFGIPAAVERFAGDGDIILSTESYEDHCKLGDLTHRLLGVASSAIPPAWTRTKDFIVEK